MALSAFGIAFTASELDQAIGFCLSDHDLEYVVKHMLLFGDHSALTCVDLVLHDDTRWIWLAQSAPKLVMPVGETTRETNRLRVPGEFDEDEEESDGRLKRIAHRLDIADRIGTWTWNTQDIKYLNVIFAH